MLIQGIKNLSTNFANLYVTSSLNVIEFLLKKEGIQQNIKREVWNIIIINITPLIIYICVYWFTEKKLKYI